MSATLSHANSELFSKTEEAARTVFTQPQPFFKIICHLQYNLQMTVSVISPVNYLASAGTLVNVMFIARGSMHPLDIMPPSMAVHEPPFTMESNWLIMYLNPPVGSFAMSIGKSYNKERRV